MRVQVRKKWGRGGRGEGHGIRPASAAASSRTKLVEFGSVLLFAASRMSFLSIVSSLGHGGVPAPSFLLLLATFQGVVPGISGYQSG